MNAPAQSPREHLVALIGLASRVVRSAWVGGLVLALGLAGTAVWALSSRRLYRSEAVLVYDRGVQSSLGGEGESPRAVAARVQDMMNSRKRLEALIKAKKLYPGIVDQRNIVEAIEEMRKHLSMQNREGYTFRISFDGETREVAQSALDMLVKSMVDEDTQRRQRAADDARKFLDTERKRADDDLKTKEGALASFIAQHPQLAAEAGGAAAAGAFFRAEERQLTPASGSEIASLEMQASQLEEALASAGRSGVGDSATDPHLGASRARAEAELGAARADLLDKQARFTNEHPDVRAALRRVRDAEMVYRQSEAAMAAAVAATRTASAVRIDDGRTAALRRALAAVRSQLARVRGAAAPRHIDTTGHTSSVAVDVQWTRLNREVSEARERQGQLEAKQFQAQLLATLIAGGQGGQLIITDPPFRPLRPVAGGRLKIALVGGVMSLMFALLAIIGLATLDDRLYGARDIERVVEDEIVVVIPKLTEKGG